MHPVKKSPKLDSESLFSRCDGWGRQLHSKNAGGMNVAFITKTHVTGPGPFHEEFLSELFR